MYRNAKKARKSLTTDAGKREIVKFFAEQEGISDEDMKEFREEVLESIDEEGSSIVLTVSGTEYRIYPSVDDAEKVALYQVRDSIESEPEMFNQDFISQYLSITPTDKRIIAQEEADSLYEDMSDRDIEREYEREIGDADDKDVDEMREELAENKASEIESELDDPIQYFVNDQGTFESAADLMNAAFISIDVDAAAQAAIDADGFAHFISQYDGEYQETDSGFVVIREG
jgi:hypothetical protein